MHVDFASFMVLVENRQASYFKSLFESPLFGGLLEIPHIFNFSINAHSKSNLVFLAKHSIAVEDPYISEVLNDMTYGTNKISSEDVRPEHVIVRETPNKNKFIIVQALCLDADAQRAIPVRSVHVLAATTGDFEILKKHPGYNIIGSDTIKFDDIDGLAGMSHQLVSQNDSRGSTVWVIDDSNKTFRDIPSIIQVLPLDRVNQFMPKEIVCFETVNMHALRPQLVRELQELEEEMDKNNSGSDRKLR